MPTAPRAGRAGLRRSTSVTTSGSSIANTAPSSPAALDRASVIRGHLVVTTDHVRLDRMAAVARGWYLHPMSTRVVGLVHVVERRHGRSRLDAEEAHASAGAEETLT